MSRVTNEDCEEEFQQDALRAQRSIEPKEYFILRNGNTVYVKEGEFFRQQVAGDSGDWSKNWVSIMAHSIDEARQKGMEL